MLVLAMEFSKIATRLNGLAQTRGRPMAGFVIFR